MAMMNEPDLSRLQRREFLWRVTALGLGITVVILGATLWATRHGWQPQKPVATSILDTPEDYRELHSYIRQAEVVTITDLRQAIDDWLTLKSIEALNTGDFEVIDHNETR